MSRGARQPGPFNHGPQQRMNMRKEFLSFSPPQLDDEEIAEVVDTLKSDWITTGPKVGRFEEDLAAAVGAEHAVCVSSCTAAMHVALAVLGVGRGDFVITTPQTFCSSVHVIEQLGATPVLVDVQRDTLNIDPQKVGEELERRGADGEDGSVKALLAVHLHGHPCDLDELHALAERHGLAVIEDAAHALAARYKGRLIGSQTGRPRAAFTCFSFYATKNITTAEGGALTGPSHLLEESRVWSRHGMSRDAWKRYHREGSWHYEVVCPGFKYNMTDIQAAIGLHQLKKLPEFQSRRREIAGRYNQAFQQLPEVEVPAQRPYVEHAWHIYPLRLNLERLRIDRARFIEELKKRNIGSSVHFIPIHLHPYYRDKYGYRPESFPVAFNQYKRLLSLPIYPRMTDQDIEDVILAVGEIVECWRR